MRITIVGAGGLGIEVAEVVEAAARVGGPSLHGFLDDDPSRVAGELPAPLRGPVDARQLGPEDALILAVGDAQTRRTLADRLGSSVRWWTAIHPTASVSPRAILGQGCVVAPFAYVGPRAVVGNHVVLNIYAGVGHDTVIADFSVLSPYATVNGHARLGEGVFLGTGAIVVVGKTVGDWSKVAAGSVLLRNVGAHSLAAGNPAKSRELFRP